MPKVTREELAEALRKIIKVCHCEFIRAINYRPIDDGEKLLSRLDAEQNGGGE